MISKRLDCSGNRGDRHPCDLLKIRIEENVNLGAERSNELIPSRANTLGKRSMLPESFGDNLREWNEMHIRWSMRRMLWFFEGSDFSDSVSYSFLDAFPAAAFPPSFDRLIKGIVGKTRDAGRLIVFSLLWWQTNIQNGFIPPCSKDRFFDFCKGSITDLKTGELPRQSYRVRAVAI
jgi:hypothetical protein